MFGKKRKIKRYLTTQSRSPLPLQVAGWIDSFYFWDWLLYIKYDII